MRIDKICEKLGLSIESINADNAEEMILGGIDAKLSLAFGPKDEEEGLDDEVLEDEEEEDEDAEDEDEDDEDEDEDDEERCLSLAGGPADLLVRDADRKMEQATAWSQQAAASR